MRLTFKELKSLIKEVAAQAPPDAPFGQWAWPEQRGLEVDEPDTEIEQEFLDVLYTAISDIKTKIPSKYIDALKYCLKNRYYTRMLGAPYTDKIYRGMITKESFIKQLVGDVDLTTNDSGIIETNAIIKAKDSYSCWTTDSGVSINFTNRAIGDNDYKVILVANVNQNYSKLIDLEPFNNNDDFDYRFPHADEKEVLVLGDIELEHVLYSSSNDDSYDIFYELIESI
jgi:hypothetical protein